MTYTVECLTCNGWLILETVEGRARAERRADCLAARFPSGVRVKRQSAQEREK